MSCGLSENIANDGYIVKFQSLIEYYSVTQSSTHYSSHSLSTTHCRTLCNYNGLFNVLFCSEVYFKAPNDQPFIPVRDVKAQHIGKLVKMKGIVTRATEVKPMMTVATYTCDQCGSETYQPVRISSYLLIG